MDRDYYGERKPNTQSGAQHRRDPQSGAQVSRNDQAGRYGQTAFGRDARGGSGSAQGSGTADTRRNGYQSGRTPSGSAQNVGRTQGASSGSGPAQPIGGGSGGTPQSRAADRISSGRAPASTHGHTAGGTAHGAPVRVRRAADVQKRPGALTTSEQRALAKREKKDREWEAGIQRVRHGVDRPLAVIIIILLCLGTVMVFSASYPNAITDKGDATFYIRRQLMWLAVGAVVMIAAAAVPHQAYKKAAPSVAIASLALLVLVLIMGTARGVARRWIYVGSVSIQPSEIAKLALILTLAWYIDKHFEEVSSGRLSKKKTYRRSVLVPGVIMFTFCGLVLLEKHLSGTVILAAIGVCVIFLSGANVWHMALTYGIPAVLAGGVYLLTNSYALQRILTHTDGNADKLKELWQTTQGLYAIGSGGLLGVGLGHSNLKYNYVSEAQNDFIFTIWCEETGLIGAVLLIALYGLFVWRGITVARRAPDTFTSLTAFGITCQVGIQALLNILVVTDLIPNTGISLPFFSYGGSSLVLLMCEMGILLSVSKHSFQKNK